MGLVVKPSTLLLLKKNKGKQDPAREIPRSRRNVRRLFARRGRQSIVVLENRRISLALAQMAPQIVGLIELALKSVDTGHPNPEVAPQGAIEGRQRLGFFHRRVSSIGISKQSLTISPEGVGLTVSYSPPIIILSNPIMQDLQAAQPENIFISEAKESNQKNSRRCTSKGHAGDQIHRTRYCHGFGLLANLSMNLAPKKWTTCKYFYYTGVILLNCFQKVYFSLAVRWCSSWWGNILAWSSSVTSEELRDRWCIRENHSWPACGYKTSFGGWNGFLYPSDES